MPVRLVIALIGATVLATLVPAGADAQEPMIQRLGGADRYETSAQIGYAYNEDFCAFNSDECGLNFGAAGYTLVRGDSFADALSAVNIFSRPILLTPPGSVPESVADYLSGWDGDHYLSVIGDEGVVSARVVEQLRDRGLAESAERYGGADRYATSVITATKRWLDCTDGGATTLDEIVVATGQDWPDGVAAAAFNGQDSCIPVVLTASDRVPDVVRDFLVDPDPGYTRAVGGATTVTIIGGTNAISPNVVAELRSLDVGRIQRFSGPTRQGTALAVAEEYYTRGCRNGRADREFRCGVTIIRPDSFADAIGAPSLTYLRGSPVIIANSRTDLGDDNEAFLARHRDEIEIVTILGATDVVSERVAQQAEAALR